MSSAAAHPSEPAGAGDPGRLRAEQSAAYDAEDFARYFALSEQLASIAPAYARSYEFWTHTVFHALARHKSAPYFLQAGAMDGKRFDPIYAFVKHYRWPGLILEPLPDLFQTLAMNYADHRAVTLVNAALTAADGERAMTRIRRQAIAEGAAPLWAEGLGTFFPERNALGGIGLTAEQHAAMMVHAERQPVTCMSLASLAQRYELSRLDLLQIDAEGCELDILRQVLAAGFHPHVIHLEHWALPYPERGELLARLGERGYRLRMGLSDVMAIDTELQAIIDAEAAFPC